MLTLNFAVTTRVNPDGSEDASIALRAVPTEIRDGVVVTRDADATAFYRGSVAEITDATEAAKVTSLLAAIKDLVGV